MALAIAAAGLLLLLGAVGPAGPPASAETTPSPPAADLAATDPPTPASPPPTAAPTTLGPLPTGLVTRFPLAISGSGVTGDTIDVSGGSSPGPTEQCQAVVAADGSWTCSLGALPDGPSVPVRAVSRGSGEADSGKVQVLRPPSIAVPPGGLATSGGIRGTAYPGATVTVTAETGASCSFPADSTGSWGCVLSGLADGRHSVTARQVAPFSSQSSAPTAAVPVLVDATAPPAPAIGAPSSGSAVAPGSAFIVRGTGEEGDRITVYASTQAGTVVACTATVAGGAWSCSANLPAGKYLLSALQRDAAGNVSPGSNGVSLTAAAPARSTPASPSTAAPAPTPSSAPSSAAPAPAPAPADPPAASAPHPGTKSWIGTPFTVASAPVVSAEAIPGWVRSVALALAALLLLILPARLLSAALARNREPRRTRSRGTPTFFGRNRPRDAAPSLFARSQPTVDASAPPPDPNGPAAADPSQRWLLPVVGVLAATLVTLSTSVPDTGAYLRLLLAVLVAVAAVNAVWVLSARVIAPRVGLEAPHVRVRPVALAIVAVTALGSRLVGLEPALLFGLVLGVVFEPHVGRARRGHVAAVQACSVAALGVIAWLTVGLLPAPAGVVSAFLVELANSLALLGLGSAAVVLLPFGSFSGKAIARWSRWFWLALTLVVYTLLFALLLPVASLVQAGAGLIIVVVAAVVFAALSVSTWLWERYVEPAR
ncbi:Ig-like domain-containing protein [Leifsonia sp. AG29]|uniref:Ig-like domain-containing protein n=1 Tax=Leifsonia sp. AG29 TaxID=2598860 RepID=UPI00131D68A3|nr:Ig-like domain-containing protein [Leifsonia sp. AG29]